MNVRLATAGTAGRIARVSLAAAAALTAVGSCRPAPPVEPAEESTPADEIWLAAGCDVEERLRSAREVLEAEGAVPIHGLDGPSWAFRCQGSTLHVTVEGPAPGGDGDPVLWVGALGDPPRVVPIRLDVGVGQQDFRRWLAEAPGPGPRSLAVDLATGVVWQP
jgi:hypothetical protein